MLASVAPLPPPQPPSAGVVVIADIDRILRDVDATAPAAVRPLVDALAGSPLVLCSSRSAGELLSLQQALGLRHPFISDGGAALHIPAGYFCGTTAGPDGLETIDFGVRRLGHAVRLVVELFRTCPGAPVVVGIGADWRDRVLLREVDVPIVIRDPGVDQRALLLNVPGAQLTPAPGAAGVAMVVQGLGAAGRA